MAARAAVVAAAAVEAAVGRWTPSRLRSASLSRRQKSKVSSQPASQPINQPAHHTRHTQHTHQARTHPPLSTVCSLSVSPLPCTAVLLLLSVVIDRTAAFIRKTGSAGEEQLLAKNRGNKKFAFLAPHSPYHAYYKHILHADTNTTQQAASEESRRREERERAEQGRLVEEEEASRRRVEQETEASKPHTLQQRLHSLIDASRLDGQPHTAYTAAVSGTPGESALGPFRIPHPSHYSASELDVVHLTALYASHVGGSFLSSLQHRERTNAAFDFLKPQHPLHSYYVGVRQSVVGVVRRQTGPLLDEYRRYVQHPSRLLARVMEAARQRRREQVEGESRQREAQEDSEVMAAIDWHSFIVVETVDFSADEMHYLPQPAQSVEEMEAVIAELAMEEDREREERETTEAERRKQERHEQEAMQLDAALAAEAAASMPAASLSLSAAGAVIEHSDEQLEVRGSGPSALASVAAVSAGASSAASLASKLVTCVVCGDTIAAEDLEEHLRIELLDPKWKQQKQALIDRQRETSLVAGKSISDNLRRYERKRRETGRERSREEEERQEREDALLLRGAARHDTSTSTLTTASLGPLLSPVPAAAASAASALATSSPSHPLVPDEPPPKRLRPASPVSAAAPPPPPITVVAASAPPPAPAAAAAAAAVDSVALRPSASPAADASVSSSSALSAASLVEPPSSPLSLAQSAAQSAAPSAASSSAAKTASAQLVAESVWLSAHPLQLTVFVRVPLEPSSPFQLCGQQLSVACRLTDTVDVLRAAVSAQCGSLPANRQQFQLRSGNFLKEGHSLAFYNVYDQACITLKIKERGGKKK